jgi:Mrp family chromosome partitioning ATPase
VSTAVPGIKDILVLGKVKQLDRANDDLIVLDAPAAGHAVTFLTSAARSASDITLPPLSRRMTSAVAPSVWASRTDREMKSTLTGSSSPLTSMTSTPTGSACAPAGAAGSTRSVRKRAKRALTSLRGRMDVSQFCSATRLLIVAGKGGVGKTTVTAALARMASQAGQPTLIVEVEGKSGIGAVFGHREVLGYQEETLAEHVKARTLTPDDALLEYLAEHGMKRISKRLTQSGALDVVSTAVPGIKDILVLGKVKQLERANDDLIVLDAPAAGHAGWVLNSAAGLRDGARVGP